MDESSNFSGPKAYYPEWWTINTHRCNHHGRFPSVQENYGLGRAFVADWGRVGSVKVHQKGGEIETSVEISDALKDKLHYYGVPVPLLPPDYFVTSQTLVSANDSSTQSDDYDTAANLSALIDYGDLDLLRDPLMGEKASAALLCAKMHGFLRRSVPYLDPEAPNPSTAVKNLIEIEALIQDALKCEDEPKQNELVKRVHQLLLRMEKTESTDLKTPSVATPKRRRVSKSCAQSQIEGDFVPPKLLNIMTNTGGVTNGLGAWRLSAAFDPFIIRLASRPVNPAYLGQGLLCNVEHTNSTRFPNENRILAWCPPSSPYSSSSVPSMFFANVSCPTKPVRNVSAVQLPSKLVSNRSVCELSAYHSSGSNINVVLRWVPQSELGNVAVLSLSHNDFEPSTYKVKHFTKPQLPGAACSVCLNPWISNELAVAGNCLSPSSDRLGYVRLFSLERSNSQPIWSGHIPLGPLVEGMRKDNEDVLHAGGLENLKDNVQESLESCMSHMSPTSDLFTQSLSDMWFHVGYADHPCQLSLGTTKRLFAVDTRQSQVASEIFSLMGPYEGSMFNSAECFTYLPSRFLGDVYILAGTTYNMVVLDKRMPGRSVLHWAHNLFGVPTYSRCMPVSQLDRDAHDLPQMLIGLASQNPSEAAIVGMNVSRNSCAEPQVVGPALKGAPLTKVLSNPGSRFPSQLLSNRPTRMRLHATTCGFTSSINDHGIELLSLTSLGDIFMHQWLFETNSAVEKTDFVCSSEWLSRIQCETARDSQSGEKSELTDSRTSTIDLMEVHRLQPALTENMTCKADGITDCWSIDSIPQASDFCVSAPIVETTQQLVASLWSLWESAVDNSPALETHYSLGEQRLTEEYKRRADIDCLTTVAKKRLERLKFILDQAVPVDESFLTNRELNSEPPSKHDDENCEWSSILTVCT
ncbi:unnamed protein product [Calicophoron daubneyi]|uniref:Uncharacterized protein n=1 Tax=Calicophoron daubneyi TaxID=300641 RepID=A0AAV2TS75_CALDB